MLYIEKDKVYGKVYHSSGFVGFSSNRRSDLVDSAKSKNLDLSRFLRTPRVKCVKRTLLLYAVYANNFMAYFPWFSANRRGQVFRQIFLDASAEGLMDSNGRVVKWKVSDLRPYFWHTFEMLKYLEARVKEKYGENNGANLLRLLAHSYARFHRRGLSVVRSKVEADGRGEVWKIYQARMLEMWRYASSATFLRLYGELQTAAKRTLDNKQRSAQLWFGGNCYPSGAKWTSGKGRRLNTNNFTGRACGNSFCLWCWWRRMIGLEFILRNPRGKIREWRKREWLGLGFGDSVNVTSLVFEGVYEFDSVNYPLSAVSRASARFFRSVLSPRLGLSPALRTTVPSITFKQADRTTKEGFKHEVTVPSLSVAVTFVHGHPLEDGRTELDSSSFGLPKARLTCVNRSSVPVVGGLIELIYPFPVEILAGGLWSFKMTENYFRGARTYGIINAPEKIGKGKEKTCTT